MKLNYIFAVIATAAPLFAAEPKGVNRPSWLAEGQLQEWAVQLSNIVTNPNTDEKARAGATSELARMNDPANVPLLISLLTNASPGIRGSASWGLCQLGGQPAQDALLDYLRTSVESHLYHALGDLTRATEAQKVLPDPRALDLLIACLNDKEADSSARGYVAEALAKIGNPKASLPLAQQLEVTIEYSSSKDYLYLKGIKMTKGPEATSILIDYLNKLVVKMAVQNADPNVLLSTSGAASRQARSNFEVYGLTLSALEVVTGRKSVSGSREAVAQDWTKWWKSQSADRSPTAPK
jgi:hypothetical protein